MTRFLVSTIAMFKNIVVCITLASVLINAFDKRNGKCN